MGEDQKRKDRRERNSKPSCEPGATARSIQVVNRPCAKRVGEAAEAAFLARAASLDFCVSKPWGDSHSYDFVVESRQRLFRVQVKAALVCHGYFYTVRGGAGHGAYTSRDIDFLVAYVVPEDLWYVLPVDGFAPVESLNFYPHSPRPTLYEKYREAWCLLACRPEARGWKHLPVICRCRELPVRCLVCPEGVIPPQACHSDP